jgi:hypothetical protein
MREFRDGDHVESAERFMEIFMDMVVPISYIGNLVMSTSMLYNEVSFIVLM